MTLTPFDDRDGHIWWNGKLIPWRDARPHVLSHGLHYGSAVFEGERCYSGNIFRLREHSERLRESGKLLGFDLPFSVEEIDAASLAVIEANGLTDAYVRPLAWRGPEQLSVSGAGTKINVMIAAWQWPNLFGQDRLKGVRLALASWKRPHPETAPTRSKAAGLYMIGTLSKDEANAKGFDDALMLDWRGLVAEATGANIFFIIDGEIHTPTPDCFLDGITRRTVIRLAQKRGIKVVERAISLDEISKASEVFLTGTAAEITPVREIEGQLYTPGRITETLLGDYEKLTHQSPAEVTAALA